jgi:hypothetical protein
MALLDEQIVEEWLNSQNFFTVRGIKYGNNEIDLLACRFKNKKVECWHVEVQVSYSPVSYITKSVRTKDKTAGTRTLGELKADVRAWIQTKFKNKKVQDIRFLLAPKVDWTYKLVHAKVKHPKELKLIESSGIELIPYEHVVSELIKNTDHKSSSSALDMISLLRYMKDKD